MKSIKNTRKGMTLAEIMVGVALVAVMIALVVSFVFMMTERSRVNQANDAILGDVKVTETLIEGWIDGMSAKEADIAVSGEEKDKLTAKVGEEEYTLTLDGERLVGTLPEDKENAVYVRTVKSLTFEVMEKDGDCLVFCTAVCENKENENTFEYTFAVNSRIGEKID